MAVVKYIGSRTYAGHGVFVSAIEPFAEVEDEDVSARLLATGRFVAAGEETTNAKNSPPVADDTPGEQWSVKQLKTYAADNGIDLDGASSKTDILAKIQEAESAIDFSAEV